MRLIFAAGVFVMSLSAAGAADVELLGVGTLPGTTADLSGLKDFLSDGTPHDRLGGLGSAIDYTGNGDLYVLASDRGPKDGAVDYACRVHTMAIAVMPGKTPAVTLTLKSTTLLTNEAGERLNGAMHSLHLKHPERSLRFDPEGIRVGLKGTYFLSDEYGPDICEFTPEGKRLRTLPMPEKFRPQHAGKKLDDELPPHNTKGRVPNRGLEGLAISPDGRFLVGAMQSPLIQDGALNAKHDRIGLHCRLVMIELSTGTAKEFVYRLDEAGNGVNEILALNDHEFLVLERDGKGGRDAKFKKVFRIDLTAATDVSGLPSLNSPAEFTPVKKASYLNLLDPKFGIAGKDCPEKFEGLTFGPKLADGRKLLLVSADNDFLADRPLRIYAFAVR